MSGILSIEHQFRVARLKNYKRLSEMTDRPLATSVIRHSKWQRSQCYTAGAYRADYQYVTWFLKKSP